MSHLVLSLFLHKFSTFLKLCSAFTPYLSRIVPAIGRLLGNLIFKMNNRTRLIRNIASFYYSSGSKFRGKLHTRLYRKPPERSNGKGSQECGCWQLFLHFLTWKCAKKWGLFTCWPDQLTTSVHQSWQSWPRTKDRRHNCWPPLPWIWCIFQVCFASLMYCNRSASAYTRWAWRRACVLLLKTACVLLRLHTLYALRYNSYLTFFR